MNKKLEELERKYKEAFKLGNTLRDEYTKLKGETVQTDLQDLSKKYKGYWFLDGSAYIIIKELKWSADYNQYYAVTDRVICCFQSVPEQSTFEVHRDANFTFPFVSTSEKLEKVILSNWHPPQSYDDLWRPSVTDPILLAEELHRNIGHLVEAFVNRFNGADLPMTVEHILNFIRSNITLDPKIDIKIFKMGSITINRFSVPVVNAPDKENIRRELDLLLDEVSTFGRCVGVSAIPKNEVYQLLIFVEE